MAEVLGGGRVEAKAIAEAQRLLSEPGGSSPRPLLLEWNLQRDVGMTCGGVVKHVLDIGALVKTGDVICTVAAEPVKAPFDGMIRGLIMNGREVVAGLKIGDVDPRTIQELCYTISDKARALGGAVLEAILYLNCRKGITQDA